MKDAVRRRSSVHQGVPREVHPQAATQGLGPGLTGAVIHLGLIRVRRPPTLSRFTLTAEMPDQQAVRAYAQEPDLAELSLLDRMRRGGESAFGVLVERYHTFVVHVAQAYAPTREIAEEAAQETCLAIFRGVQSFKERCSMRTSMLRIVVHQARRMARREMRSIVFPELPLEGQPAVDPTVSTEEGHWTTAPRSWDGIPPECLLSREISEVIRSVIAALPQGQRAVITMRDVQGLTAEEARQLLDISEGNQRVLLHRARWGVRVALLAIRIRVAVERPVVPPPRDCLGACRSTVGRAGEVLAPERRQLCSRAATIWRVLSTGNRYGRVGDMSASTLAPSFTDCAGSSRDRCPAGMIGMAGPRCLTVCPETIP